MEISSDSESDSSGAGKIANPKTEPKVEGLPKKKKSRTLKKKDDSSSHPEFIKEAFARVAEKNEIQLQLARERAKREAEESKERKHSLAVKSAMKLVNSSIPEVKAAGLQLLAKALKDQGLECDLQL
jgi:hypothetical protein